MVGFCSCSSEVESCGNLSLCNLRTCHQSFRSHPHLTAPVHGVYRTCPASEGEGQRRNDATYSTGSLPCPGLSAWAPRSLLSHTPMVVFRFIFHLVELFARVRCHGIIWYGCTSKGGTGGTVAVASSMLGHRVGMRLTLLTSVGPSDCHRHSS